MTATLKKDNLKTLFEQARAGGFVQHYKKIGKIIFRRAVPGETVITTLGGKVETLKQAGKDDCIIQNIMPGGSAETYIIDGAKFQKRYEPTGEVYAINGQRFEAAVAIGEIDAFVYEGPTIHFVAPWGQLMLCESGDMLCTTGGDDIYRIAIAEFKMTYEFVG
jgi:hypothetical protein